MRRLLILLAAGAALAGCSFELEGAACSTPGTTDQCPTGQKCGLDKKCSERAAKPDCNFCTIPDLSCGGGKVGTCAALDEVCNTITVTDNCPSAGLTCSSASGTPRCECPSNSLTTITVNATQGKPVGVAPYPTGLAAPPSCAFDTVGAGLAEATRRIGLVPATPLTVSVADTTATNTFSLAGTLTIPKGVTLKGNVTPADPAKFVLDVTTATTDLVSLEGGAGIEGFTVRSDGATTGDALEVACAPSDTSPATLNDVVVDGGSFAARGVVVMGACSLNASRLEVHSAMGDGLHVETGSATVGATVQTLSSHDNGGYGVRVMNARLALTGGTVRSNDLGGIRIDGALVDALVEDVLGTENGAAGILVRDVGGSTVRLRRNTFAKNAGTSYGPVPTRDAGGVLLWGNSVPVLFEFQGNTVCSNGNVTVDEVGVYSTAVWSIAGADGTSCLVAGRPNLLTGQGTGKLVYSTGGIVNAQFNLWPGDPTDPTWFTNVDDSNSCGAIVTTPTICL